MFRQMRRKSKIKQCQNNIADLERRRARSQAALVEAILTHTSPSDEDVDFFNKFTAEITDQRDEMHRLQAELKKLEEK